MIRQYQSTRNNRFALAAVWHLVRSTGFWRRKLGPGWFWVYPLAPRDRYKKMKSHQYSSTSSSSQLQVLDDMDTVWHSGGRSFRSDILRIYQYIFSQTNTSPRLGSRAEFIATKTNEYEVLTWYNATCRVVSLYASLLLLPWGYQIWSSFFSDERIRAAWSVPVAAAAPQYPRTVAAFTELHEHNTHLLL